MYMLYLFILCFYYISTSSKDDPGAKLYKKWIIKSKQHKKYNTKHKNNGNDGSDVLTPSTNLELNEQAQQRDQSQNSSNGLMYVVQDWSKCNATCQSVGYQERNLTCSHVTPKFVKNFADSECQNAGLQRPATRRECKVAEAGCAVWRAEPWSQVSFNDSLKFSWFILYVFSSQAGLQ